MRKTRLVILPTKCLHQMGFLLLFLSCPVIGDWGRIRPETENAHLAIQRARGGTCGLQRNPSRELITYRNLSNQCLKDANVEDHGFKPILSTNADTRVREGAIKIERKDIENKRNIQAKLTRISENRRHNVVQQRRILNNLRQTEKVQNSKLINDRKVIKNINNRMSSRNNNANFRRLSLARIQFLKDEGTRKDVLNKLSVRQYQNNREQFMEKNFKNSFTRREARGDEKARNLNERLENRRNDKFSRSQLQNNDIRRQNDRTITEKLEKEQVVRQKAVDRQVNEELVRSNNRVRERQNNRQESNKNFSRRMKFSEGEKLILIKSEEKRGLRSTNKRLNIRKDNEIMRRRVDTKSRRILQKRSVEENINIRQDIRRINKDEASQNRKTLNSRQISPDILMLQNSKKDLSYTLSRTRNVNRLNDKVVMTPSTFEIFKTNLDRNIKTNDKDTSRNVISFNAITNKLSEEKRVKENQEIQQLNEYLILRNNEDKNKDFIHTFLKWSNLPGYNIPKMKDWIGNCFIGAAAYYLASRQVKVI